MRWILPLVLLAISCTSVPTATTPIHSARVRLPSAEWSRLYVTRPGTIGASAAWQIAVDGVTVGMLPAQSYMMVDVRPGEHTVTAAQGSSQFRKVEVSTLGGNAHFVRLTNRMNLEVDDDTKGRAAVTYATRKVESLERVER